MFFRLLTRVVWPQLIRPTFRWSSFGHFPSKSCLRRRCSQNCFQVDAQHDQTIAFSSFWSYLWETCQRWAVVVPSHFWVGPEERLQGCSSGISFQTCWVFFHLQREGSRYRLHKLLSGRLKSNKNGSSAVLLFLYCSRSFSLRRPKADEASPILLFTSDVVSGKLTPGRQNLQLFWNFQHQFVCWLGPWRLCCILYSWLSYLIFDTRLQVH